MSRIRLGFVGVGSMGQCAHLANYAVLPDCEVAAIAELREDPGDGAAPREIRPTLPSVHAMRQQAAHFLAAVRGERTPFCRPEEALEDLRTARRCLDLLAT